MAIVDKWFDDPTQSPPSNPNGWVDVTGLPTNPTGTPNDTDWVDTTGLPTMPTGGWSQALAGALQDLTKSPIAKQPDNQPLAPVSPGHVDAGKPLRSLSLDALVQLLERRQAQYGGLSGQPVAQPRTLGLLGF